MKIFSVNFNKSINDKYGATATLGSTAKISKDEKGRALKCTNQNTDYITYGNLTDINNIGTGEFSFVVAFNIKSFLNHGSGHNSLFGKGNVSSDGFNLSYTSSTNLIAYVTNVGVAITKDLFNKNIIIAVTRNITGNLNIYVNGVKTNTNNGAIGNISSDKVLAIGTDGFNTVRTPNASIYLAEVYNHVLSNTEIQKLTSDFLNQQVYSKPKTGFIKNTPTDLSREKDKVVGSQIDINGDFSSWSGTFPNELPSGWSAFSTHTVDHYVTQSPTGACRIVSLDGAGCGINRTTLVVGRRYRLSFDLIAQSGNWEIAGLVNTSFGTSNISLGRNTFIGTANATTLTFKRGSVCDVTIDNLVLQEVTGLVAAYNMKPLNNVLIDISGNGCNTTVPSRAYFNSKNGLTAVQLNDISGNYDLKATGVTPIDFSYCISLGEFNIGSGGTLFRKGGKYFGIFSSSNIKYYEGSELNFTPSISATPLSKGGTLVFTYVDSTKVMNVYVNGSLAGTVTLSTAIGYNSILEVFGVSGYGGKQLDGEVKDIRIYNRVLSTQEIKDYHNLFISPTIIEDFSVEPTDGTSIILDEWEKISGAYKVVENTIQPGDVFSFNSAGATGWTNPSGKIVNADNTLLQYQRCYITTNQTIGKRYKINYTVNSITGTFVMDWYSGGSSVTSITTPGTYSIETTCIGTHRLSIWPSQAGYTLNVTFDSITEVPPLQTISKGTKYLECVTAGLLVIPSKQAYGTWEWDIYKGADANETNIGFINNNNNFNVSFTSGLSNGYYFRFTTTEVLTLGKNNIGAGADLLNNTVTSYIAINTWYRIKITRSNVGAFTVLIKGGSFTPTAGYDGWTLVSVTGGSGTNPVTNNTYTTSNYLVLDLDAGDRISNLIVKDGIIIN
jgi:hypothetical protein